MNHRSLSFAFALVLAFGARVAAADVTPAEAADRQFLANLEKSSEAPRPGPEIAEAPKPAVVVNPPVKKEAPPRIATSAKRAAEPVAQTKREEVPKKTEVVEVRRAIPVTTATTSITKTSSRDRHDEDEVDNDDNSNGFFHRLFRGEKIFR